MATYRVWASYVTDCYLDVEADSKEEAERIAEETDGSEFTAGDGFDEDDWHICYGETTVIK